MFHEKKRVGEKEEKNIEMGEALTLAGSRVPHCLLLVMAKFPLLSFKRVSQLVLHPKEEEEKEDEKGIAYLRNASEVQMSSFLLQTWLLSDLQLDRSS